MIMIRKTLAFLSALLLIGQTVFAAPIGADRAREAAQAFYAASVPAAKSLGATDFTLVYPAMPKDASQTMPCYVFNVSEDKGFVVMSGDDDLQAVLGYSFQGTFRSKNMPANLKWWLSHYEKQIRAYQEAVANGTLEARTLAESAPKAGSVVVAALLENFKDGAIRYDQDAPYSDLCPNPSNKQEPMYTGCVATALAQIARFYEYPYYGQGTASCTAVYGRNKTKTYTLDLSKSTYDWENMLCSYSQSSNATQKKAIATLMRDIGYACSMEYAYDGSGAYDEDALDGMIKHMDYNAKASYEMRNEGKKIYYTDSQWYALVKGELDKGRPLYYSGADTDPYGGGHAFVCDGYRTDNYFHFNWGWSGDCDGWYTLENLEPNDGELGAGAGYGNYNDEQGIFINFFPAKNQKPNEGGDEGDDNGDDEGDTPDVPGVAGAYNLITSSSALEDSMECIIVCKSYEVAMGEMNGKVRSDHSVEISGNAIKTEVAQSADDAGVHAIILQKQSNGNWALYDKADKKYISSTTVKVLTNETNVAEWTISVASDGNATLKPVGKDWQLAYNQSSPRFTTYKSINNDIVEVQIFVKRDDDDDDNQGGGDDDNQGGGDDDKQGGAEDEYKSGADDEKKGV
ncbi:MAG: C10 family peptidase, partial [Bacteroidales bacterium]|nr:C10 family peptidase [Bacteroidales bacterium]